MTAEEHRSRQIRVLIADDEALMRQSMRVVIDSQADMCVVGEASSGDESVAIARRVMPDVVVTDIRMPRSDGIRGTAAIIAEPALSGVKVLVLSMYELDEYVLGALRAGASGFLLKDAHPTKLLDAIRRIHEGEALFAPSILTRLVDQYVAESSAAACRAASPLHAVLTSREREVLTLVARGLSNREIAVQLHVSGNTVKTHIGNLLAKLHVRDRAQLVIAAYESGLTSLSGSS